MLKLMNMFPVPYNDGEGGNNPPPTPPTPPAKTFTQEQLDSFLAAERRKHVQQKEQLLAQMEEHKKRATLTEEERTTLQQQIEELRGQSMTKEQLLTRDLEKVKATLDTTSKTLSTERDTWASRHNSLLMRSALLDAAVKTDVVNAEQILELLTSKTKIVQRKDTDGKPLDEFEVLVVLQDKDPQTKAPVRLELPPEQALARMKEMPENANLFKSTATGGLGKTKQTAAGTPDLRSMTPQQYREYRKTRGY